VSRKPDSGRETILSHLKEEIVGPKTGIGNPLNIIDGHVSFKTRQEARGPWFDAKSGQEILSGIRPKQRYGAGILAPESEIIETLDE